jgi:hypothetical protein
MVLEIKIARNPFANGVAIASNYVATRLMQQPTRGNRDLGSEPSAPFRKIGSLL